MRYRNKAAALGMAVLALWAVSAAAQTVKIGVLTTHSGREAEYGRQIDRGMELYMKHNAHRLPPGVKVELVLRDDGGPNPDKAKQLAQELIVRDRVQLLTGLVWTPNTMAIAPLATEAKVPMVVMVSGSSPVPERSPYIVRYSYGVWQVTVPLAEWAAKRYNRAYLAVSDFAPGHDTEQAFEKGYAGAGREIVGKVRIPMSQLDYTPFMQRVKDAKPNVLFFFVPQGPHMTALLKAAADLDFPKAGIRLLATTDPGVNETLHESAIGMTTAFFYTTFADRPSNKAFVAAYRKEYGNQNSPYPDWVAMTAYDAMDGIYTAIREQKGRLDPERTVELLKNYRNPNSPRGPMSIDPATRDIVQNVYLREVRKVGGNIINVELEPIATSVKDPWKELTKK